MKKEIHLFSIAQYDKEQEYLREMHKKGWKFVKLTAFGIYHFEKCAPEDVVYQLDYNAERNKEEYIKMFEDCKWEHIMNCMGYSYFRKPVSEMGENEEEIFCDDNSRINMIKRIIKGRMLPLLFIFLFVIIPNIYLRYNLESYVMDILFWIYFGLLILYIVLFIVLGVQFIKLKNKLMS